MLMNMKDLLAVANKHNFAVPAFNVSDYSMFKGLMEITEELNAPIIIAIHPDELKHTGVEMVKAIIERLHKSTVPSVIHLDHGASYEQVQLAIQNGFTSVMIDGSSLPFGENIAICQKIVAAAHPVNVSVEGELGTIGTADDFGEAGSKEIKYTDPEDAKKFIEATGVDCLAIAIGTCHGIYPKGVDPKLRLDILKDIKAAVPETPLVLHGGSANPDSEIGESVTLGVNKINISSDIKVAYFEKMREVLQDKNVREPNVIQPSCIEAMKEVAAHKIKLFQADGKASLY
ncbi:MAG: ketose-bisphosphate aldolase [Lachnospiraceae bacterium]|nr:ketose-bisphosphate aldolase [Lachnospiraceae bacterium]MDD7077009.1 ketose-bisphosphate aldolase [Lachnospiraceae bacterium]MDY3730628.1 ketose-bisphosphate aldolase [Candidatus Choladocola sp.]